MRVKHFTSAVAIAVISALAFSAHANNGNTNNMNANNMGHNWMPSQPQNMYWQAPNFNFPGNNTAPPAYNPAPMHKNAYQPPMQQRPPAYRPTPRPAYNYPPPNMNNHQMNGRPPMNNRGPGPAMMGNQQNMSRPAPEMMNRGMNNGMNRGMNRGYPPPPRGPYGSSGPDNGASAYNIPGYNRYRNNNGWDNNKFWGQSGPSRWMNPNKRNMEQGWDDMINAPSRMGEMPGGWTAPEVSMPNPIDMGDQMQDNLQDLPEQIRDMDVGN